MSSCSVLIKRGPQAVCPHAILGPKPRATAHTSTSKSCLDPSRISSGLVKPWQRPLPHPRCRGRYRHKSDESDELLDHLFVMYKIAEHHGLIGTALQKLRRFRFLTPPATRSVLNDPVITVPTVAVVPIAPKVPIPPAVLTKSSQSPSNPW